MKEKILPFIKKYPMSILLAIIALNLFSIAGSLKTSAKLDYQKLICSEQDWYSIKELQKMLGKYSVGKCNQLNR